MNTFNDGKEHVICPNCGQEIDFGTESGFQFVTPPTPGIHMLRPKNTGLDFSKFVAANKDLQNMDFDAPRMQDEITKEIYANGYIKNTKGHRRFVTAQMFQMLNAEGGYTAALNKMPYKYQWEMLIGSYDSDASELKTLAALEKTDKECFEERSMFFTRDVIRAMLIEYVGFLRNKLLGRPFFQNRNGELFYLLDRMHPMQEILLTIEETQNIVNHITPTVTYDTLYRILKHWYRHTYINLCHDTDKNYYWKNAYKGSGAYYTMMNLVKYHDCFIAPTSRCRYYGKDAVSYLQSIAKRKEGWELLGMLKEMISENDFKQNW